MSAILTEICTILVGGIETIASGIGGGLTTLVTTIFVDNTTASSPKLTAFGAIVVVFAGVGLAIGLSRAVVMFVTSLGARNRL